MAKKLQYDMTHAEYRALEESLVGVRKVAISSDVIERIRQTTLDNPHEIAGNYLFGSVDQDVVDINGIVHMRPTIADEYEFHPNIEHQREIVEDRRVSGAEYIGFAYHKPRGEEHRPSDCGTVGDVRFVADPLHHSTERLYVIGILWVSDEKFYREGRPQERSQYPVELNLFLTKVFDSPKRVLHRGRRNWRKGFRRDKYDWLHAGYYSPKPFNFQLNPPENEI